MKWSMIGLLCAVGAHALADAKPWPVAELRHRFQVTGEVFTFDASGKKILYKSGSWRAWRTRDENGVLRNDWSSGSGHDSLAFRHEWRVQDDGTIKVKIEQFANVTYGKSREEGPELSERVRKVEKVLENLEPIDFVTSQTKERRVIVRFTPGFVDEEMPKDVSFVPISGTEIAITDNEGHVWAEHLESEGKYAGFTTHRGALYLSYYPFPGAKEIGWAAGRTIEVRLGPKRVATLTSTTAFLPHGLRLKVYGLADESHKTRRLQSSGMSNTDDEASFLRKINRR